LDRSLPCYAPRPVRFLFFYATAATDIYTLSLHDALPIWVYFNFVIGIVSQNIDSPTNPVRFTLNLAQLGALCLSNLCAIKPLESNLETSYKLLFHKLLSICINIQHLIF